MPQHYTLLCSRGVFSYTLGCTRFLEYMSIVQTVFPLKYGFIISQEFYTQQVWVGLDTTSITNILHLPNLNKAYHVPNLSVKLLLMSMHVTHQQNIQKFPQIN